jgi:ligand-binding sensor domain-containing protein
MDATEEGVTRYDGKQVKKYVVQEQDPKYGLSHNNVYALAADNNYGVWIGTSAGLDAYNHKTEHFQIFILY